MIAEQTVVMLKEIADITSGKRPGAISKERSKGHHVPIIGGGGVSGYTDQMLFDEPLLITGRVGTLGKLHVTDGPVWPSDNALILRPKTQIVSFDYLRYACICVIHQAIGLNRGAANPLVTQKDLGNLRVTLHSFSRQNFITDILSTIDTRIDLLKQTNQTLEAIAQTIFKSWFVNFDPVHAKQQGIACAGVDAATAELFPNSFEDSELGQIPKGWRAGKLSEVVTQEKATIVPSAIPNQIFDHYSLPAFDVDQMPTRDIGFTIKSNKTAVTKNSILVSKLNPRIPRVWWPANPNSNSICSTEFIPFAPRANTGATKEFVYSVFNNKIIQDGISQQVSGTSGSHQRVRPSDITTMNITIPPPAVLKHFSSLTSPLLGAVANNRRLAAHLSEVRDTLLPRLISGKLDVSAIEAQLEEMA